MRGALVFLAILGLFAAGATIGLRFREAAAHKVAKSKYDVTVPATIGYQASTSGWEFGDQTRASPGGGTCVTVFSGSAGGGPSEGNAR